MSFRVSDLPKGLDFEPGVWPAPWTGRAFVSLIGDNGGWAGARLVTVAVDPTTGALVAGSDTTYAPTGSMLGFATGWDDGTLTHGRPWEVTFALDGRLFVSNVVSGDIVWIAPLGL